MRITLFFTRGMSFKAWVQTGMVTREVALYRRLLEHGIDVDFVTYGNREDVQLAAEYAPGVRVLCNRWRLPDRLYQRYIHYLHAPAFWQTDLIKTNQIIGGREALQTAHRWRKPVIARCGYMHSDFVARKRGAQSERVARAKRIEEHVFSTADAAVVTTPAMAADIRARIPNTPVYVIPNYVETERFKPLSGIEQTHDIVFVGRLDPQKNVVALLEAIEQTGVTARIIGDGSLAADLKARFGDVNGRVVWCGQVPNEQLPRMMQEARLVLLPSRYEGHPKVLIEGMAAGMPVIGGDSRGIREIITHGENGWLTAVDSASIAGAITTLLADAALRQRLGENARSFVLQHYALDRIVQQEIDVYRAVLS
ncbi:MAG: glycosyltransferase family 4 protein [Chloroflexi bacterium]|nr:glycosyltransferase family 4 protein [Chloroflexota bacterium]